MTRHGPSPETSYPIPGVQRLGFLKNFITRPTIVVNVRLICAGDVEALEQAA